MTLVSNGGTTTLGLYDTQSQLDQKADIIYVDDKFDNLNINSLESVQNTTSLRSYIGVAKTVKISSNDQYGIYQLDNSDTTSLDNDFDVIVDSTNRRWKRAQDFWEPVKQKSFAENMYQTNVAIGGALTISCFGDSMTYGQDTLSTTGDLQPGINGSTATRALYQYPESLGAALTQAGYTVTVNNYGFPGDTSANGVTRWASTPAANIAIIMYGHNDANVVATQPSVSPADYKRNITKIILREQRKGAFVVLLTPPRLKQATLTGANTQRQQNMRIFESTLVQLAEQFGIPCVAVDELVGHRGAEIYSDDVHFNKYGYNEWGWNLSALIMQRSDAPKKFAVGTVMHGAGSSHNGIQTLLNGTTVMIANTTNKIVISGYFVEDVIPKVLLGYNTGIGGAQRIKIEMDGGTRNNIVARSRIGVALAAPGKFVNGDVVKKGYRTFTISVASTTTNAYIPKIEFVSPNSRQITDTSNFYSKMSSLNGIYLPAAADLNRWIIDDSLPLTGDFYAELKLIGTPTGTDSIGMTVISEFVETSGIPSNFLTIARIGSTIAFTRLANPTNTDEQFSGKFAGTDTLVAIERVGDTFNLYAEGALVKSFTSVAWGRVFVSLFRNNAILDCKYLTIR